MIITKYNECERTKRRETNEKVKMLLPVNTAQCIVLLVGRNLFNVPVSFPTHRMEAYIVGATVYCPCWLTLSALFDAT